MNHEEHEKHERHERHEKHEMEIRYRMRLASPLDADTEALITRIIGCAIAVHQALGPGFLESIYKKAIRIELEANGIAYECERPIRVMYRGIEIRGQRVDFIVSDRVIVELKAIARFDDIHRAQLISYLKTTGLRAGLLINFRVPILPHGLKRVVV